MLYIMMNCVRWNFVFSVSCNKITLCCKRQYSEAAHCESSVVLMSVDLLVTWPLQFCFRDFWLRYIWEQTNSAERNPYWVANSRSASQEIPRLGIRRFVFVFTISRHWTPFWARWIQPTSSHPISAMFILILSSHLRLPSAQIKIWFCNCTFTRCASHKIEFPFSFLL
jgi:hypothetical protein